MEDNKKKRIGGRMKGTPRKDLYCRKRMNIARLFVMFKRLGLKCNGSIHEDPELNLYLEPTYDFYGAKGIRLCSQWESDFWQFKKWAEDNGYTGNGNEMLVRINPDGDFEPDNCKWVTLDEWVTLDKNKCSTFNHGDKILIKCNNEIFSIVEFHELFGWHPLHQNNKTSE